MNINFNRNLVQMYVEDLLSIDVYTSDKSIQRNNRSILEDHVFISQEISDLNEFIQEDAKDYFFNGCVSLLEGINSLFENRFSWATIKLYYAVFYFLRSSLACNKYSIIRVSGNHYYLHLVDDEKVNKLERTNTHQSVIQCYKTIYSNSDPLLSNNIDLDGNDLNSYDWLEEIRNITNYKQTAFLDPDSLNIWDYFSEEEDKNNLLEQIIKDNTFSFCFQYEYAAISIPIERLKATRNDFKVSRYTNLLSEERKNYLKTLPKIDESIKNLLIGIIC